MTAPDRIDRSTPAAPAGGSPAHPPLLRIEGLCKRYGSTTVFEQVSLQVQAGECVALLGESGVGKSTLLNCIAGLDEPDVRRRLESDVLRERARRTLAEAMVTLRGKYGVKS